MQNSQFHPLCLLAMSQTMASRSVRIDGAGLDKVRQRMAELEKPLNPDKRGWSQEDLERQAYVSISTVKRFLKGNPVDRNYAISIIEALGFDPLKFIAEHDSNLHNSDREPQPNITIDWQRVCQSMLKEQQEEQRFRRRATEMGFEINVFVPLGLIERKQQQRRSGNVPMELVHQLEQEVITRIYEHNEFMTDVIGQNPTGKNKHIAIVGEPGAGKTTLLDKIATHIQENNLDLPICIALASLQGKTLKDYILQEWFPEAMTLVYPDIDVEKSHKTSLQKRLRQDGVWLLLDGVDEMAVGANSCLSLEEIRNQLTDWLGNVRVVLTCRTNVWDARIKNPLTGFDTYKTQEFKQEQVDDFIQHWFAEAKNIHRGQELQKKLQEPQKERIRQLVKNPLRLSLLCQIFSNNKQAELPETKAELYQHFVRYFFEWKPSQTVIDWATQPGLQEELYQALGRLSIAGLDSDTRFRLPLSLIEKEMGDRLFKLAWDLGWLNLVDREAATDEPVYAFFHPTFQEYFAALAIDDWHYFLNHVPHNPDEGIYRIFEPQWKEVILLWLGQDRIQPNLKEELLKNLLNFDDNCERFYSFQAYFIAIAGLSEFRYFSWGDEMIDTVIEWSFSDSICLESFDILEATARAILQETDTIRVVYRLTKLLKNNSDDVSRVLAARMILRINPYHIKAVNFLINKAYHYRYFGDVILFEEVCAGLTESGILIPKIIRTLIECIRPNQLILNYSDSPFPDNYLRISGAKYLEEIDPGNPHVLITLLDLLRHKSLVEEVISQFSELENFSISSNIISTLVCLLQAYHNEEVKLKIAQTLVKLDPSNREAVEFLKHSILNGTDEGYRLYAARSLSETRPQDLEITEVFSCLLRQNRHLFQGSKRHRFLRLYNWTFEKMNLNVINKRINSIKVNNRAEQLILAREEESLISGSNNIRQSLQAWVEALKSKQAIYELDDMDVFRFKMAIPSDLFPRVVANIKEHFNDELPEEEPECYESCYAILWHCAQNMSYPEFYRAWHS
ncbi:NACHT domain-containing protein [Microcoleus sp. B4-C5]|uniref:NACHT domain-containing protein n=1 Tax=unclassified Microcoleus TaxID=2642155 RepID=UPI002FD60B99